MALRNLRSIASVWTEFSWRRQLYHYKAKERRVSETSFLIKKEKGKIYSGSHRSLVHQNIFASADSVSPVCCFCSFPNWPQSGAVQGIMVCGILSNEYQNRKLSLRSVDKLKIRMPSRLRGVFRMRRPVKSVRIKPAPITGVRMKSC